MSTESDNRKDFNNAGIRGGGHAGGGGGHPPATSGPPGPPGPPGRNDSLAAAAAAAAPGYDFGPAHNWQRGGGGGAAGAGGGAPGAGQDFNNFYYPGSYTPFSPAGDIRDSIAAIWSRTSPSGEGVAFSGAPYGGQFPDSNGPGGGGGAATGPLSSAGGPQFNSSPAAGQFAANLTPTGHFSDMSMFGAAAAAAAASGDYAAAGYGYSYGPQYTQWPDSGAAGNGAPGGRGGYSYLGGGGGGAPGGPPGTNDRIKDVQHGMESMKLQQSSSMMMKKNIDSNGYSGGGAPKKMSWANVASQPAKPAAPAVKTKKPGVLSPPAVIPSASKPVPTTPADMNSGGGGPASPMIHEKQQHHQQAMMMHHPPPPPPVQGPPPPMQGQRGGPPVNAGPRQSRAQFSSNGTSGNGNNNLGNGNKVNNSSSSNTTLTTSHPVLDTLKSANDYNPKNFDLNPKNARFFVIKSFCEDDIHRSIKFEIWCSTDHGNKRLDAAWNERQGKGPIYLLFSVNGSGHFCGMAQMLTGVDYTSTNCVWVQDKFKGQFKVRWIYVKDVPNGQLRHIRLENNENKPVTNSRDTQEVPPEKGKLVLKIIHGYKHSTSIFDDFVHYEKRQEMEENKKKSYQQNNHNNDEQHHHHQRISPSNNDNKDNNPRGPRNKNNHHHHHHSSSNADHHRNNRN